MGAKSAQGEAISNFDGTTPSIQISNNNGEKKKTKRDRISNLGQACQPKWQGRRWSEGYCVDEEVKRPSESGSIVGCRFGGWTQHCELDFAVSLLAPMAAAATVGKNTRDVREHETISAEAATLIPLRTPDCYSTHYILHTTRLSNTS